MLNSNVNANASLKRTRRFETLRLHLRFTSGIHAMLFWTWMVGGIVLFVYSPLVDTVYVFANMVSLFAVESPSVYTFESIGSLLFVGPHWSVLKHVSGFWVTVITPLEWLVLLFCIALEIERAHVT